MKRNIQKSHVEPLFMKPSLCDLPLDAAIYVEYNIKDQVECGKLITTTCDAVV